MSAGPWKLLLIVVLLLASRLSPGLAVENGKGQAVSGDIFCAGTVRYAIGGGRWLNRTQGTAPIVLPFKVETGATAARVTIPSLGVIEGQKNSRFTLSLGKDGMFNLTVIRGTVLYSLHSETKLLFVSPIPQVESLITCTSSTKSFQWTPGSTLLGEITVDDANTFHLFNLNGDAVILHNGKSVRTMAAGRALQVIYVRSQEVSPADRFKMAFMPLSDGGNLIFKDQVMPNNWNLVAQYPQPTAEVRKWDVPPAAIVDDHLEGGYLGYSKQDPDDHHSHDNPDRPPPQDFTPTVPSL